MRPLGTELGPRRHCIGAAALVLALALSSAASAGPGAGPRPVCRGYYAANPAIVAAEARRAEDKVQYSFCVRSTAVYQCAAYRADGSLFTKRHTRTAHGTAFAFRRDGASTLLLTNEHVLDWPTVTSDKDTVDGIQSGCKRVELSVTVVDNESDTYARDDVTLQTVVADAELDAAVLKGPLKVQGIPFAFGQSSALEAGDAVRVRGFPLAAFQAVHSGKVISPREPDFEGKWDHYDFVIDAQLSGGSSGSPVLALSCKTGGWELVGIYHARWIRGQALNVVVGIDELREMLTTLKPRRRKAVDRALTADDRKRMAGGIGRGLSPALIPFAGHVVGIRQAGDRLLYDFYPKRFPLVEWREAVLEDVPAPAFGRVGRVWFGNEQGLAERAFSVLSPAEQDTVVHLVSALRLHWQRVLELRRLEPLGKKNRADHERLGGLVRRMDKAEADHARLVRALGELVAEHAPSAGVEGLPITATLSAPSNGSDPKTPSAPSNGGDRTKPKEAGVRSAAAAPAAAGKR